MNKSLQEADLGVGLMTVRDVARYLRLSEARVYQMAQKGLVPAIRIGKCWRFKKDLIDEWIRRKAVSVVQS